MSETSARTNQYSTAGTCASGYVTFNNVGIAIGDSVTINGDTYTYGTNFGPIQQNSPNQLAQALYAAINCDPALNVGVALPSLLGISRAYNAQCVGNRCYFWAVQPGTAGNSMTLTVSSPANGITASGSTLTGAIAASGGAAVTIADGADVTLGSKADLLASNNTSPYTVVSLLKGSFQADTGISNTITTLATTANITALQGVVATQSNITALQGIVATSSNVTNLQGAVATQSNITQLIGVVATQSNVTNLIGITATASNITNLQGVVATQSNITALQGIVACSSNQTNVQVAVAPGAPAAKAMQVAGVYSSAGVTLTNNQSSAVQMDAAGRVIVSVGAITSNSQPWELGSNAFSNGQVTLTSNSTLLLSSNTSRQSVILQGSQGAWVGSNGVNSASGWPMIANTPLTLTHQQAIYAAASNTNSIIYWMSN